MRYDQNIVTDANIVSSVDLAALVDAVAPLSPEHTDFELPRWIWGVMLGGYATFFAGLFAATAGEQRAVFAIIIGVLYTAMFFGTARILGNVDARRVPAFTRTGRSLHTWTRPMDLGSVVGQVLTIPLLLGFFGIAIACISAFIF